MDAYLVSHMDTNNPSNFYLSILCSVGSFASRNQLSRSESWRIFATSSRSRSRPDSKSRKSPSSALRKRPRN
ncbi:hypothetical protein GE061_003136 [Apolygus lucorum]|uniref:Uncharacterized protein n=1 Tax=Apolygus lucorum TaxID=248454 RepID=A0A6A4K9N5_APOLU|nr:hypothetical protein GE061_003136 [Apolygus lucorum]